MDGEIVVTYSVYAHLSEMNVNVGDFIEEGSIIGAVGRTGNVNENVETHLHFEIRQDSYPGDKLQNLNPSSQFNLVDRLLDALRGMLNFKDPEPIPEKSYEEVKNE